MKNTSKETTRVLIIAGSLRIGGAEKVAADIGFYADPQKYTVHYVVFGSETGAYEPELTDVGCFIFRSHPKATAVICGS